MKLNAILLSVLILSLFYALYQYSKPSIQEISAVTQKNIDGAWIIQYEYALDGAPQIVFLQDDSALREYRAYLKRIGRFHE